MNAALCAGAEGLGVGEELGAEAGVEVGDKGLLDRAAVLTAQTDFAKPTVIVQIIFSG